MSYVEEEGQKIDNGHNDMMEVQAQNKLIEFGRLQLSEANKKLRFQEKEKKLRENYLKLG